MLSPSFLAAIVPAIVLRCDDGSAPPASPAAGDGDWLGIRLLDYLNHQREVDTLKFALWEAARRARKNLQALARERQMRKRKRAVAAASSKFEDKDVILIDV